MVTVARCPDAPAAQRLKERLGPGAVFVGGGTLLQPGWGSAPQGELTLIDVNGLAAARGIARTAEGLRIGAATPLESVRRDPLVRSDAPLLAAACETLAAVGVRHLATLGGNAAWRCGDTLAALLALDAQAERADGTREPLAAWLARAELPLLVALHVPAHDPPGWSVFEKVGRRAAFSPTRLALAAWAAPGLRKVRVAVTGAGLAARRLPGVEALLEGARALPGAPAVGAACGAALPDPALARLAARLLRGHLGAILP